MAIALIVLVPLAAGVMLLGQYIHIKQQTQAAARAAAWAATVDPSLAVSGVPDKVTVPYLNGKSAAQNGVKALDVGPIFTVLVEQAMDTVHTSSHVQGIGGPPDFSVPDNTVGDSMTALSSAQVYFSRPRSLFRNMVSPSSRETGNLFSPYWQARLVDTPCLVRQEIAVTYGALTPCL